MRTEPRQFDVWRLRNGSLVLILQDEIMDHLTSRVVAPLIPASRTGKATKGMNPAFDLGDEPTCSRPNCWPRCPSRTCNPLS